MVMRIFGLFFILALASGCAHMQTDNVHKVSMAAGPAVTREEVLQTAEAYASHQWKATSANIYHGKDSRGVWVDTPDEIFVGAGGWYSDGRTNVGLPYCWGGASSLKQFDEGISAGRPAGYHFTGPRAHHGDSALPVGVDCSGFVSCCWQLHSRRSTYNMAPVCYRLESYDDLRPGDAVNKSHDHIILFVGWVDGTHEQMRVYEAGDARKDGDHEYYERVHQDGW
jgi:hypothetical protein